jgi:hypothetical protein
MPASASGVNAISSGDSGQVHDGNYRTDNRRKKEIVAFVTGSELADCLRAVRSAEVNTSGKELANACFGADRVIGYGCARIFDLEVGEPFLIDRIRERRAGPASVRRRVESGGDASLGAFSLIQPLGKMLRDSL